MQNPLKIVCVKPRLLDVNLSNDASHVRLSVAWSVGRFYSANSATKRHVCIRVIVRKKEGGAAESRKINHPFL